MKFCNYLDAASGGNPGVASEDAAVNGNKREQKKKGRRTKREKKAKKK